MMSEEKCIAGAYTHNLQAALSEVLEKCPAAVIIPDTSPKNSRSYSSNGRLHTVLVLFNWFYVEIHTIRYPGE